MSLSFEKKWESDGKMKLSPFDIHHFCLSLVNTGAYHEDYGDLDVAKTGVSLVNSMLLA